MQKKISPLRGGVIVLLSILIIVNMGAIYYGSSIESTTSGNMTKEIAVNIYAHAEIIKPENKKPDAEPASSTQQTEETPEQIKAREEKQKADAARKERQREIAIARYNTRLRDSLHVLEYVSLSFFVVLLCLVLAMKSSRVFMIPAAFFSCLYALSDEIHQLFVAGRSFEIRDIMLDCSGIVTGIILGFAIFTLIKKYLVPKG